MSAIPAEVPGVVIYVSVATAVALTTLVIAYIKYRADKRGKRS